MCVCVWGRMHGNLWTCVCVCERERGLHIHPNWHTVYLGVGVCAGDSVSARVLCFSVCQSHFTLYNHVCVLLLLCYWFVCGYLCIPCFCLIKWQSVSSRRTRTINSMCVGGGDMVYGGRGPTLSLWWGSTLISHCGITNWTEMSNSAWCLSHDIIIQLILIIIWNL